MEYKDYYKLLGLQRDATPEEIKKKYRKLARSCHPDTCKDDPDAEKRFKEINEAHEVLSDPEKRSRYDALGNNWQEGQSFRPPPGYENIFGGQPFGMRSGRGGRSFSFEFGPGADGQAGGGFSDFFESLFGDLGMDTHTQRRSAAPKGSDLTTEVTISLEDAHRGSFREIHLQGPGGDKRLNVKIPAGAYEGMKIRLSGQGNAGPGGSGDLYLKIRLAQNGQYRLEGNNIVMDIPVAPWDAALGVTKEIQTLDGTYNLKIPQGVSSGQRLRLKGRGFARKGDLFAQIKIMTPKNLNKEEERLFTELRKISTFKP
ncbi:MAG: DnaJ domain-containing protein [Deltaproteobacteria bacterium]|nr:DnaJ domain-containing protein [Deltaproteobacteria bacterium]